MAESGCTWSVEPEEDDYAARYPYVPEPLAQVKEERFSLGENVVPMHAQPVGAAPIPSDLPVARKASKAAEEVRAISVRRVGESWTKFAEEVRVQRLVWESLMLTRKALKDDIGAAEASLTRVLDAYRGGDAAGALELLREVVERGSGSEVLSVSMLKSAKYVLRQDSLRPQRTTLAEWLEYAADQPSFAAEAQAHKQQLEELLSASSLEDKKLERSARQALSLPVPVAFQGPQVSPTKKPSGTPAGRVDSSGMMHVHWTGSRTLYELTSGKRAEGSAAPPPSTSENVHAYPPVYMTGSRTLSEVTKGVPLGATATGSRKLSTRGQNTIARQTLSQRSHSLGAVATATESMRSSAARPEGAAAAVRKMAAECPSASWTKLRDELDVQAKVWESVALLKPKPEDRQSFQTQTAAAASRVREVLRLSEGDLEAALSALERLLASMPKDAEGQSILNKATCSAAQDIITQYEAAPFRLELVERLEVANIPATLPRDAEQKSEVEDILRKSELRSTSLELVVRQMLLLPIPEHLAKLAAEDMPPAKGERLTSAKPSGVSSRRNSSIAAAKASSRKESRPLVQQVAASGRKESRTLAQQVPTPSQRGSKPSAAASAKSSRPLPQPAVAGMSSEPGVEEEPDTCLNEFLPPERIRESL